MAPDGAASYVKSARVDAKKAVASKPHQGASKKTTHEKDVVSSGQGSHSDSDSGSSFLAPLLEGWRIIEIPTQSIHDHLQAHLLKQSRKAGLRGEIARQLLQTGQWIESAVQHEVDNRKHAIGGIDQMWNHLSHYDFNPVCAASFILKDVPKTEALMEANSMLVEKFPKYRSKLTNLGRKFHGATFVPDPQFDVRNHISIRSLPHPAGRDQLDEVIAELESKPWDFDKPLWEMVMVDNYKDPNYRDAKAAIVLRGHHTMSDGQGFVMSQLSITSYGPEMDRLLDEAATTIHDAKRGAAKPSKIHRSLKPLDKYRRNALFQFVMFMAFWTVFVLSGFVEAASTVFQGLYMAVMYILTCWRIPKVTPDYPGPRVAEREFASSVAFPMSDVKAIQKAFSGVRPGSPLEIVQGGRKNHTFFRHLTLNDVICTALADVIGHELRHPSVKASNTMWSRIVNISHILLPRPVALMIPISIREIGDQSLQNWSTGALAYLPNDGKLPTAPSKMYSRLHSSSNALSILKTGYWPLLGFWLINIPSGQVPLFFPSPLWAPFRSTVAFFVGITLTAFTAVLTNVPGPQPASGEPVTIAESEILNWSASPPQAGKGTLGIGIITYGKSVSVTICADKVEGAEGIAKKLVVAFENRWKEYVRVANDVIAKYEEKKSK